MTSRSRFIVFALTALLVTAVAAPALATAATEEPEVTETTVAEPVFEGDPPVVIAPPLDIAEEEQPWTARFLYPLLAVTAVVLIAGTAIAYNRRIRNRYVVE